MLLCSRETIAVSDAVVCVAGGDRPNARELRTKLRTRLRTKFLSFSRQLTALWVLTLFMLLSQTVSNNAIAHIDPGPGNEHPGSSCSSEGPFGLPGVSGTPDQIGAWGEVLDWPVIAIHMTLLHTGKVLFWRNARPAYLFDPISEAITPTSIPGPESPEYNTEYNGGGFMFCDGHVTLADGRVLAAGGTVVDPVGLPDAYLYDPDTGEWSTTGFMEYPRYYPSLVTLLDGRVLAHSGLIESGEGAIYPEVYDPATETWNTLRNAGNPVGTYSRLHALSDGRVFKSGAKPKSRYLDVDAETWTLGAISLFAFEPGQLTPELSPAITGTMYRRNQILKIGGYDSADPTVNNLNRVEQLDLDNADPQWREILGMEYGRRRANSVILPDGTLLVVGGAVSGQNAHECAVHAPELWDPDTELFTTLASQQRPRMYHSTALLLPDGRVLSASGENTDGSEKNAEIYSPPYLFAGPRPSIVSAPTEVSFEHDFVVVTPDATEIDSVVLIRPGSVTHQVDMNQRYVELPYTVVGNEIHTTAPPNADAPPGYYMLFILQDGVPAVAPMVLLSFDPNMDTDGDGMPDNFEDSQGLDKNDPVDAAGDPDADGLTNLEEYQAGTKPKNADWDHDDLSDPEEIAIGTDPNQADSDGDEMPDGWENQHGLNPLDPADAVLDNDFDGLNNLLEYELGRDPNVAEIAVDTDLDGMPDDWETEHGLNPYDPADALLDSDGDWVNNLIEYQDGSDPFNIDSDGDGLNEFHEKVYGTDPTSADSDNDGVDDATEIANGLDPLNAADGDGDSMPDDYEVVHGLDPDDPADAAADRDGDGLINREEYLHKTDLDDPDTDDDGLSDADEVLVDFEIAEPTDPLDPDTDDDGMPDGFEVPNNLDAHSDDTDGDPDNDGLHNYGEYRLGGDPWSAGSPDHAHNMNESFESGVPAGWEVPTGATGWTTDSGDAADGSFSLRSGNINDSANSEIVLPLFVHDSVMHFQYFVSSQSTDKLQIFLDDVLLIEAGGDTSWTQISDTPLLEGFHEVRFVYSKDGSGQSGCDCARIDSFELEESSLDLDGDGMPGAWEDQHGLDRNDPSDAFFDPDADSLTNIQEYRNNTDPRIRDTDGDWLADGYEVLTSFTDPTLKDTDSDQVSDFFELFNGNNPLVPDWPAVQVPAENPGTENKRVLGKILFWEEQLSSDNTVACGTCHMPGVGGGDPRVADAHPGPDGLIGTEDDVLGSPGMMHRDSAGNPVDDPLFGFSPQVTRRNSPSIFVSMFATELFLDGRAGETFVDPGDGSTELMTSGAALETQAVEPIVSPVEMGNDGRSWAEVTAKLETATPLALARNIPPDMAAAVLANPDYPQLFAAAFGDTAITPARIAMAIASYERTLIPDQTPWDLYMNGDKAAMNTLQISGWELLRDNTQCTNCHTPPLFTDNQYWNIGLRPAADDAGRMEVTGSGFDYGRFKTATLRNIGLRNSMMHTGQVFDTKDAVDFYMANHHANRHTQFAEFQTGIPTGTGEITDDYSGAHLHMTTPEGDPLQMPVLDFLNTGLTDPRVANAEFPFDRPQLASEPPDSDADGMLDEWENAHGLDKNNPADALLDIDGDGLNNLDEYANGTDPNDRDSDNDWLADGFEVNVINTDPLDPDSDGDTMPDFWEAYYSVGPNDPASGDGNPDGDAYTNLAEYQNGTNPNSFNP